MEAEQFMQQAVVTPELRGLLERVAADAAKRAEYNRDETYTVTGVEVLIAIAAYALFRFLKDNLDFLRGLNEVEVVLAQEKVIDALIKDGFQPEQAVAVTKALLDRVAGRDRDDPAFKAALKMLAGDIPHGK